MTLRRDTRDAGERITVQLTGIFEEAIFQYARQHEAIVTSGWYFPSSLFAPFIRSKLVPPWNM